jgi:hypothetical protein
MTKLVGHGITPPQGMAWAGVAQIEARVMVKEAAPAVVND